jgi:hypothetical protein
MVPTRKRATMAAAEILVETWVEIWEEIKAAIKVETNRRRSATDSFQR